LNESSYVLNKNATWGIAVPHKTGFKIIRGDTHPTATNHDHLSQAHCGLSTDEMLVKHPGTVRYLSQKDDNGKRELSFELSTHPKSTGTARQLLSNPKHLQTIGGHPYNYFVDFKDNPRKNFDIQGEYADNPHEEIHKRLRTATAH
jgi:hypothetical protein